jgi:alginate O-acetyltransferase complex protein AlgI
VLFNSLIFLIFLVIILLIYLPLRDRSSRAAFLLAASYFFYACWDWRFISLLAVSTLVDYAVGRGLERTDEKRKRKRLLLVSCFVNLGILGIFKYFNFFLDSIKALTESIGLNAAPLYLHLVLPVGISFYTFKTLSYTIGVYRRKLKPTHSLPDYALFVAFFPNLVAGPIDRAKYLLPQIADLKRPTRQDFREAYALIALGLFKKVLIGDAAGRIVNNIFGQPKLYRSPELLAGLVLFSIQIYADFGGYSNIARGVAKLFSIELMRNFEQPYLARSFSEFWRRWHISLSTWIWDYVFNPLMSAVLRQVARLKLPSIQWEMRIAYPIAAVTTMLLCGLWHGAGVTFIIWGGLHGLFLSAERLLIYRNKAIPMRKRIHGIRGIAKFFGGWATTQLLVGFAWLFFRSEGLHEVNYFLGQFLHWSGSEISSRLIVIILAFALVVFLLDIIEYVSRSEVYILRLRPMIAMGICTAVIIVVSLYMATNKAMPFFYLQF